MGENAQDPDLDEFGNKLSVPESLVFSLRPVVESVNERAYSADEIGRWLAEAGFKIRGVHDAETLLVATGCPTRIIIIAQKAGAGCRRGR